MIHDIYTRNENVASPKYRSGLRHSEKALSIIILMLPDRQLVHNKQVVSYIAQLIAL